VSFTTSPPGAIKEKRSLKARSTEKSFFLCQWEGVAPELSERAKLYEDMGNPTRAVKDWERCIANISDHEGVNKIRARIDILKKMQSRIH
jgi:hypothetical protein